MSLSINPTITTNSTCNTITLTDNTTADTYGSSNNLARAAVAIYLRAISFNDDGTVKSDTILSTGINPITDASWAYLETLDGYYQFQLIAVNLWAVGTPLVKDAIVYYNGGTAEENGLYKALVSSTGVIPPDDATRWVKVTSDALASDTAGSIAEIEMSAKTNYVYKCNSEKVFLEISNTMATALLNVPEDCLSLSFNSWEQVHALYNSLITLATENRYLEAQKVAQYIQTLGEELNCTTC